MEMDECVLSGFDEKEDFKKKQKAEINLINSEEDDDYPDVVVGISQIQGKHEFQREDGQNRQTVQPEIIRSRSKEEMDKNTLKSQVESVCVVTNEEKESFNLMSIEYEDDVFHQKYKKQSSEEEKEQQSQSQQLPSSFEIHQDSNNLTTKEQIINQLQDQEEETKEELHDNYDQIRIVMIGESKQPPNCCDLLDLHDEDYNKGAGEVNNCQQNNQFYNENDTQQYQQQYYMNSDEDADNIFLDNIQNSIITKNQNIYQQYIPSNTSKNKTNQKTNSRQQQQQHISDTISQSIIEEDDQDMEKSASEGNASLEVEDILNMSDERMFHRKVLISEPELITEGYITTYKLYRIKSKEHGCVVFETEVLRRFSDFEWLYNELVNKYGGYLIPVLPEKNILTKFNVETPDFTKDRQRNLEFFLQKLLDHPKLHAVPQLKLFICARNEVFSLVKGEAESQKTIEQKYQNVLGSVRNYIQASIVPLFGGNSNNNTTSSQEISRQNTANFDATMKEQSELDKDLNNYEIQFSSLSAKVKQLMKICESQSELMEEELKASNQINYHYSQYTRFSEKESEEKDERLNESSGQDRKNKKKKETLMNQTVLNIKENAIFQWQKQFQPSFEVWFRNCLAAEEALNRRKEIVQQIMKDSRRIQELSLLNKKHNNQRDTEMDILQNNYQKNKQRLENINGILGTEIKQFDVDQQLHFNQLLQKFKEIQLDLHYKSNEIYQGRVPYLI